MGRKKYTEKERIGKFWSRVEVRGLFDCWRWTATQTTGGYGSFWDGTAIIRAHRFVWRIVCGTIPLGLMVLHKCDHPYCVNPAHLYLGTQKDNMRDRSERFRRRDRESDDIWHKYLDF